VATFEMRLLWEYVLRRMRGARCLFRDAVLRHLHRVRRPRPGRRSL